MSEAFEGQSARVPILDGEPRTQDTVSPGDKVGYLKLLGRRGSWWTCICDCGNSVSRRHGELSKALRSGHKPRCTISCQCGQKAYRPKVGGYSQKHHPMYVRWQGVKQRCENPNSASAKHYYHRGITICRGWSESFPNFVHGLGMPPFKGASIERVDNSKGYWCGMCEECVEHRRLANCKWATPKEQNNNRGNTTYLTVRDWTLPLTEWSRISNIPEDAIRQRIANGWPNVEAIFFPIRERMGAQ